jgi:signal transduction histidine kinase
VETVLASLARLLRADWIALIRTDGRLEAREGGRVVRRSSSGLPRDLDPGLLSGLEPGRAASFGPKALRRWPRTADSALGEIAAYATGGPSRRLLAGWKRPIGFDLRRFEELARFVLAADGECTRANPSAGPTLDAACATHDLRHLLTVALLELEHARLDAAPGRTRSGLEPLARVQAALEGARALCESAPAAHEPCSLLPILESAAGDARIGSGRRDRVAVHVRCAPDLAVAVERNLLERAVRNLVANAIEATTDGGAVEVEAVPEAAGEIGISVRDEGRGIAREDLRELLRAGRSGSGGSGLGTASARDCVRSLGGRLLVRSRPRAGTEFVIRLPRSTNAAGRGT